MARSDILFDRMRGVRPAALPPAPASPVAPPTPADAERDDLAASQQRAGPPSPRTEASAQLPPVLPTIGEGSLVEEVGGRPRSVQDGVPPRALSDEIARRPHQLMAGGEVDEPEPIANDRRSSRYGVTADAPVDVSTLQGTPNGVANDQPASAALPVGRSSPPGDRRNGSRGENSSEGGLATYTAFLDSDIARERSPPVPVKTIPASAFGRPPQNQPSEYFSSTRPGMIDTKLRTSQYGPTGGQSADQQVTAVAHNEVQGDDFGTSRPYGANASLSAAPTRAPLPSPGAPSLISVQDDRDGSVSPGLPYLAHSPTQSRAGGFPPAVPTVTAPSTDGAHASSTTTPDNRTINRDSPREAAFARMEDPAEQSDRSLGTRVSQAHDGTVVDSPEDLPLESPTGQAFSTRPLFAGRTSDAASASPHIGDVGAVPAQPKPDLQQEDSFAIPSRDTRLSAPDTQEEQARSRTPPLRVETSQKPTGATAEPGILARDMHRPDVDAAEEPIIHSDLMAAINFVEQAGSPVLTTPHTASSVEPSPAMPPQPFKFGPPQHSAFAVPPSPSDEHYGAAESTSPKATASEGLPSPPAVPARSAARKPSVPSQVPARADTSSFPSSFAQSKRDERVAAAQLAQQAQQAALTRPGRAPGAAPKKKMWEDSDEEEEAEQDDSEEDEEEEPLPRHQQHQQQQLRPSTSQPRLQPSTSSQSLRGTSRDQTPVHFNSHSEPAPPVPRHFSRSPQRAAGQDLSARQSFYDYSAGAPGLAPSARAETIVNNEDGGNRKPALNPHGLLATGILEREERSARAQENAARDGGSTLVSLPSKVPPPQTGLVGAITSHQREKERTGGVGRALTEQQKERKLAEQRQRQLDDLQKQQIAMMQQQMQMAQFGGGFNPMAMGSMGYGGSNPWMMGGMGPPSMAGFGGFPGMPSPGSQMGGQGAGAPSTLQPQHSGDANAVGPLRDLTSASSS